MSDRAGPSWSDIGNLWEKLTELQNKQAEDRRDRFAAAALTGMLSSWRAQYTEDDLARHAAAYTDAIIAELDKEQP